MSKFILFLLAVGTLLVITVYGIDVERHQTDTLTQMRQSEDTASVAAQEAARSQMITARLTARTQKLLAEANKLQLQTQLCAINPRLAHCHQVRRRSRRIIRALDRLEVVLVRVVHAPIPAPASPSSPSGGGKEGGGPAPTPAPGPGPTTSAAPPPPAPVPGEDEHSGNSDQCPPNNPHCP